MSARLRRHALRQAGYTHLCPDEVVRLHVVVDRPRLLQHGQACARVTALAFGTGRILNARTCAHAGMSVRTRCVLARNHMRGERSRGMAAERTV